MDVVSLVKIFIKVTEVLFLASFTNSEKLAIKMLHYFAYPVQCRT